MKAQKNTYVLQLLVWMLIILGSPSMAQHFNSKLDEKIELKITQLLAKMTLEEKVGQTCQITLDAILKTDANGKIIEPITIDSTKLNEAILVYQIGSILNVSAHTLKVSEWEKLLQIINKPFVTQKTALPILYGIDAIHGMNYSIGGTLFPQEIGLAATWNPSLAREFGNVTAYEMRSCGIHWNFSPVLDLARQPLWSRFFETLGEDPYLVSQIGKNIINGYQGEDKVDSFHGAACLKHFVGYSMPTSGRDRTPALIPTKQMEELFLPPFKVGIDAGAMTLMINSGDVNGIPGHANYHLLTEVLKDRWGFKGFTVSDWEDFIMLQSVHNIAPDIQDAMVQAFNAGVDMSMVPYNPQYKTYCELMVKSLKEGKISQVRLDDAVRRILRVKMAVGLFEKNFNQNKDYKQFGSLEAKKLAYQSAAESITLLKNKDNLLPLSPKTKVLVAGPTANNLTYLNGAWTHTWQGVDSIYNTKNCTTVLQAVEAKIGKENTLFAQGASLFLKDGWEASELVNTADFKSKADQSDVIVLCLGELPATEKPGDIRSLNLLPAQMELAKLAYETNKPVILVMIEARPRIIHGIVEEASAIMQAYLPGDYGAKALVDILFGSVNPSGKLPYTYPKYDGVIEFYDHPKSVDRSGKTNQFNAYDPEWDFGFGLSYSDFKYQNLKLNKTSLNAVNDSIVVSVEITNNSARDGQEVVQLYLSDIVSSVVPAGKKLIGFQKIHLKGFETKKIDFILTIEDLKFVNNQGEWISESGIFEVKINQLNSRFELNK
jgi:beta-glucosidase